MNSDLSRHQTAPLTNALRYNSSRHRTPRRIITISPSPQRPMTHNTRKGQSNNLPLSKSQSDPLIILTSRSRQDHMRKNGRRHLISITLTKNTITGMNSHNILNSVTLSPRNMTRNIRHLKTSSSNRRPRITLLKVPPAINSTTMRIRRLSKIRSLKPRSTSLAMNQRTPVTQSRHINQNRLSNLLARQKQPRTRLANTLRHHHLNISAPNRRRISMRLSKIV